MTRYKRWQKISRRQQSGTSVPSHQSLSRRRGGRIVPQYPIDWYSYQYGVPVRRCLICGRSPMGDLAYSDDGTEFCYTHQPSRAQHLVYFYGVNQARYKYSPSREVCLKILRLCGRHPTGHKPPRPKGPSRDRRYVNRPTR